MANDNGIIKNAGEAIESLGKLDQAIKNMYSSSTNFFGNINSAIDALKGISNIIPGMDGIAGAVANAAKVGVKLAQTFDGLGQAYREITKENLNLSNSFGEGLSKATEFNNRLIDVEKTNKELADTGFFINIEETSAVFKELGRGLGDSREEFLKYSGVINGVSVSAEQMAAALQGVSGLESYSYYRNLNALISKNGLSFKEAAETIVSYKGVAEATGLTVQTVADTLTGAVSGFSKLGITVDFAKPALEGFASTLKSVGLGIGEASELAQTLSRSLLNVGNDYGKAFVMFQQGNLDFGGGSGGALGASIGFRAKMMDATPEEQESIGLDLVKSMRDTLVNFSGGQGIVSVKEAAESPELQNTYFMQEQMLSSMFGMSDQGQRDRTLELLQQLDEAVSVGDTDTAQALAKQLEEAGNQRNETKSMSERLGALALGSFGEHIKQTALLQKQVEVNLLSNPEVLKSLFPNQDLEGKGILQAAGEFLNEGVSGVNKSLASLSEKLSSGKLDDGELAEMSAEIMKIANAKDTYDVSREMSNIGGLQSQDRSGGAVPPNIAVTINGGADPSRYFVYDEQTKAYYPIGQSGILGNAAVGVNNPARTGG